MTDSLCIDIVVDDLFDVEYVAPVVDVVIPEPVAGVVVVDQAGPPGPPPEPQAIAEAVSDYLTTNPVLPPQAGKAGNVLSTDGADPSWMDITPPVTLTLLLDNALV
ncbi:hypothetical protein PP713_08700 [Mycobacterium sp. CSUR Q5927]|nr:hypothetical protein [Mycobacterium sp. CSUR Q5927]